MRAKIIVSRNTCIMAAGWSAEATRALITIWGEENIQEQLDNVKPSMRQ